MPGVLRPRAVGGEVDRINGLMSDLSKMLKMYV